MRRAIVLVILAVGCTRGVNVPGVVVEVSTDLDVPAQLDGVDLRVRLENGQSDVVTRTFTVDPAAAQPTALPFFFGLYPKEGSGTRFTVTAVGKHGSDEVVSRSATLSFPKTGPTVVLPLPLLTKCTGMRCSPGQTCQGAALCLDDLVVAGSLLPYRRGDGTFTGDGDDAAAPAPGIDAGPPRRDGPVADAPVAPDALAIDGTTAPADGPAPGDQANLPEDTATPPADLATPPADTRPPPPRDVGPLCTPAPEDCFNGVDDDCDGLADCADPDCVPATAQCVPIDLSTDAAAAPGVSVAAGATCPTDFDKTAATTLRTGVSGGACTGCKCDPSPTTCGPASIYTYDSAAACAADMGTWTGGGPTTMPTSIMLGEACTTPNYTTSMFGTIYGLRTAAIPPVMGMCPASGTPTPGAVTWASTTKFCPTSLRGAGCPTGQICVPKPPSPAIKECVLYASAHACPTGTTKLQNADWYTGANDTRGCTACTCVNPTGGSCASLIVHVGHDYSCMEDDADIPAGSGACFPMDYSPGLQVNGAPTNGSCTPMTSITGTLAATGRHSVCCL